MPTVRSKAAFRCIKDNNSFYANFLKQQHNVLSTAGATNISSYDLFIVHHGIECAMFPHLYPEPRFTDTGIMQPYLEEFQDNTNRVVSIGFLPLPLLFHCIQNSSARPILHVILANTCCLCYVRSQQVNCSDNNSSKLNFLRNFLHCEMRSKLHAIACSKFISSLARHIECMLFLRYMLL